MLCDSDLLNEGNCDDKCSLLFLVKVDFINDALNRYREDCRANEGLLASPVLRNVNTARAGMRRSFQQGNTQLDKPVFITCLLVTMLPLMLI